MSRYTFPDPNDFAACEARLRVLSGCACCADHNKLKPDEYIPWVETPEMSGDVAKPCECSCRHEARELCRRHPNWILRFTDSEKSAAQGLVRMASCAGEK